MPSPATARIPTTSANSPECPDPPGRDEPARVADRVGVAEVVGVPVGSAADGAVGAADGVAPADAVRRAWWGRLDARGAGWLDPVAVAGGDVAVADRRRPGDGVAR
jgi:hypothetical protein